MKRLVEGARVAVSWLHAQGWRRLAGAFALLGVLLAPMWAPPLLGELEFFRIRKVEIVGVRYLAADEVFGRLGVDTAASVWDAFGPWRERIEEHPQVLEARLSRRLPGTLVIRIVENEPVALYASRDGMRPVDRAGRELPFDPSRVDVDLPVIAASDPAIAALLAAIRDRDPAMFDRISDVRRIGEDQIVLSFPDFAVRATPDLSPARLADIIPVELDLARRGAQFVELDLRYRDQVIARLQ